MFLLQSGWTLARLVMDVVEGFQELVGGGV